MPVATTAHWPLSPDRSLNNLSAVPGQDQGIVEGGAEKGQGCGFTHSVISPSEGCAGYGAVLTAS